MVVDRARLALIYPLFFATIVSNALPPNPCRTHHSRYSITNPDEIENSTRNLEPCFEKVQESNNGTTRVKNPYYLEETSKDGSTTPSYFAPRRSTIPPRICTTSRACIPLCCPLNCRMIKNQCVEANTSFEFPRVYESTTLSLGRKTVDQKYFDLIVNDPCKNGQRFKLSPTEYAEDAYMLLDNGTVYQVPVNVMIYQHQYCFGVVEGDKYDVIQCFESDQEWEGASTTSVKFTVAVPVGLLISIPCLFITFLVYCVLPELRNMHGRTLRGYVGSLLVAYVALVIVQMGPQHVVTDILCIVLAFTIHFSFLASFFWLNVMCFDIWWTFGGFRSLQGSVKQRERKKFIIYSIYAWGSASLLTGVCIVMDFVPSVPQHFIRPQFGAESCWFSTDSAKAIYFYGPMGITVFMNICLFVSTALKIVRHKKDTAHHLKGSDSRRHDDNKQWFNLYLKLFIVMGISWSMEIISWLCKDEPKYIWYVTDLPNTLQGLIIFLIFVCKGKIKRLLFKRFGCSGRDILSRNSTRSAYPSCASRTCTTSAAPLQEKINPYLSDPSYRNKGTFDDSDCA